jgi:hypothetical protein
VRWIKLGMLTERPTILYPIDQFAGNIIVGEQWEHDVTEVEEPIQIENDLIPTQLDKRVTGSHGLQRFQWLFPHQFQLPDVGLELLD